MWEKISKPHAEPPHATIIICGPSADANLDVFGPRSESWELVTYHRLQQTSDDGVVNSTMDVYRVQSLDAGIIDQIPARDNVLFIYCFSWLETDRWTVRVNELSQIGIIQNKHAKLLLTTTNYDEIMKQSHPLSVIDKSLDICHQYLRTMALQLNACLAYSIPPVKLDWHAIVSHVLQVPISTSATPEEAYYGSEVVIYGNDTREKIMAVNPDFDFDLAQSNQLPDEAMRHLPSRSAPFGPVVSLPEELQETVQSYEKKGSRSPPPMESKVVSKVLLEGSDDKKVISDFFTTMVQRSS